MWDYYSGYPGIDHTKGIPLQYEYNFIICNAKTVLVNVIEVNQHNRYD